MSSILQHHRQTGNVLHHYRQTLAVVVKNLEDVCGQIDQVYLCIWQVVPPSGQLASYSIPASSLTWASMPLKASKPPNNQVSTAHLTLAIHRPAGFAAGKNTKGGMTRGIPVGPLGVSPKYFLKSKFHFISMQQFPWSVSSVVNQQLGE